MRIFVFFGNFFRSVQGWAFLMLTVLPTIWATFTGYMDDLNWSERTLVVMGAMLIGLGCTYFVVRLWETVIGFSETRKEQGRIASELNQYIASGLSDNIDLPTAAAIWSGSREEGNARRHLCFRALKGHINNGRIRNPVSLNKTGKANIGTSVPLSELIRFFVAQKIIKQSDIIIPAVDAGERPISA